MNHGEPEVVLHEEVPVVQKTTQPVERVRLDTREVTTEQTVSEEVRKEHVETDGDVATGTTEQTVSEEVRKEHVETDGDVATGTTGTTDYR
jgi:hypothetical protein